MNIRTVDAGRGSAWIGDGFNSFKRAAGAWIAITVVFFVIFIALALLPVLGNLLSQLLTPVFMAGIFLGCRAMDEGADLELGHLFRGFSANPAPLFIIGALYLVSVLVLGIFMVILAFVLLGGMDTIMQLINGNAEQLLVNLPMLLVVILVGLGLYVPILMALWFAPALVALGGLGVGDALSASFKGCLLNILPFLIWSVIILVLAILAAIPFGLGFLVLVPMIWAGMYSAYKEIFLP